VASSFCDTGRVGGGDLERHCGERDGGCFSDVGILEDTDADFAE